MNNLYTPRHVGRPQYTARTVWPCCYWLADADEDEEDDDDGGDGDDENGVADSSTEDDTSRQRPVRAMTARQKRKQRSERRVGCCGRLHWFLCCCGCVCCVAYLRRRRNRLRARARDKDASAWDHLLSLFESIGKCCTYFFCCCCHRGEPASRTTSSLTESLLHPSERSPSPSRSAADRNPLQQTDSDWLSAPQGVAEPDWQATRKFIVGPRGSVADALRGPAVDITESRRVGPARLARGSIVGSIVASKASAEIEPSQESGALSSPPDVQGAPAAAVNQVDGKPTHQRERSATERTLRIRMDSVGKSAPVAADEAEGEGKDQYHAPHRRLTRKRKGSKNRRHSSVHWLTENTLEEVCAHTRTRASLARGVQRACSPARPAERDRRPPRARRLLSLCFCSSATSMPRNVRAGWHAPY